MKLGAFNLLLLFVACSPSAPDPINARIAAPYGSDAAFWFSVHEWENRLGPPGHNPSDTPPRVRWYQGIVSTVSATGLPEERCCYIEYDNIAAEPVKVYSMYWPWNFDIDVTPITSDRPSGSGLAHETLHWVLASSGRDVDGDYQMSIWKQEPEVKADLEANGL